MTADQDPFADSPAEVLDFLRDASSFREPELRINVLSLDKSREYSAKMQQISVGRALGLVVLIDADDSNPYCYISRGVARGMIVHFRHDPEPEIHFADLESFKRSLAAARAEGLDVDELPRSPLGPVDDESFVRELDDLAQRDDEDSEFLLVLFLPLLSSGERATLEKLARHESFFVREAVAELLVAHPCAESREIAARLAEDRHPQVARPGKKALSAANRLFYQGRSD